MLCTGSLCHRFAVFIGKIKAFSFVFGTANTVSLNDYQLIRVLNFTGGEYCIVVKRNGSRQNFDRNKILNSMIRAFDKRKVDVTELDRITLEIEQTIQNSLEREITTDKIGEMVMERLKPIDEVAYIRFASIYHRFQDAGSFMREISKFLEDK